MRKELFKKFKNQDEKTKIVSKNILISAFIKVVSITTSFISVPLLLSFLTPSDYGVWITMSAFLGWFGIFDLGIGNGLRNKLTEALTNKNFLLAQSYVSTAYVIMTVIFFSIFIIFLFISSFVNWSKIFNAGSNLSEQLLLSILILFGSACLQFVLKLIFTILTASHRIALADVLNTFIQTLLLICIWQFSIHYQGSQRILAISAIYSVIPIIAFILINIVLFYSKYDHLKPKISLFNINHFNAIAKTGFSFFFIQLAAIIIYTSDNMLITHLFSPEQVTIYYIAFKYFSILTIGFGIILGPIWSMFTRAYTENDINWILKISERLFQVLVIFIVIGVLLLLFSNNFYKFWTRRDINIPISISIICFIYAITYCWGNIYANILNALSEIKIQLQVSVVIMFINIPLAYLFAKICNFGIVGIPLSIILCMFVTNIILHFNLKKILANL